MRHCRSQFTLLVNCCDECHSLRLRIDRCSAADQLQRTVIASSGFYSSSKIQNASTQIELGNGAKMAGLKPFSVENLKSRKTFPRTPGCDDESRVMSHDSQSQSLSLALGMLFSPTDGCTPLSTPLIPSIAWCVLVVKRFIIKR